MQATTDEVLIGRIASGDRLAMQVLFARHHVRVFRFVLRLVRDETFLEEEAIDLLCFRADVAKREVGIHVCDGVTNQRKKCLRVLRIGGGANLEGRAGTGLRAIESGTYFATEVVVLGVANDTDDFESRTAVFVSF